MSNSFDEYYKGFRSLQFTHLVFGDLATVIHKLQFVHIFFKCFDQKYEGIKDSYKIKKIETK